MYGTKIRTDADDSSMEGVYKDGKCREKEMGLQPVFCIFIADGHFNKSMTLDVENKLMHYLLGSEAVKKLNNRRANAQGDYYTKSEFDRFFRIFGLGFITGSGVIPLRGDHS